MINNLKIKGKKGKRGQITIFVIIAILLIAVVGAYFLLRGKLGLSGIPKELAPVYEYFLTCVQEETEAAADLMGAQAGYIKTPDFVPGSEYMPFSSQLDFLGFPVPYWYYVSGNNIIDEQVPTKQEMTKQLEEYLDDRISECEFSEFISPSNNSLNFSHILSSSIKSKYFFILFYQIFL